jgi:CBS domain-containing protein/anti-sigma regulatory factor (Ser/Thr protein kinase)
VAAPEQPSKLQEIVHELMVRDVMTTDLITVSPEDKVRELRDLLRVYRISGLPVVDRGAMVGIISLEDFIECLADRKNGCVIAEKMTRKVETLFADDPLVSALARFDDSGLGRYPVVERESGKLVGILTKGDVIEGLLKKLEVDYHEEELHRHRASHIFEDIEADDTTVDFQYYVEGQNFDQAGEAASRLKRTLRRLGIRPEIVRRVAIACYEAEMNLVIFTAGGTIGVRVHPSEISVDIKDSGPGIADAEKAMQPGYSTASDWVRELGFGAGMGLPNIKNMSDEFEIDSGAGTGTTLRLEFSTNRERHEAS